MNNETLNIMIEKSISAMKNSYSPYSNFPVGACIRTPENEYFVGCNYEIGNYSLTICAERMAIGQMVCAGFRKIADIVVVAEKNEMITPCGSCRQAIAEFADENTRIHFANKNGNILKTLTIDELLPYAFKM